MCHCFERIFSNTMYFFQFLFSLLCIFCFINATTSTGTITNTTKTTTASVIATTTTNEPSEKDSKRCNENSDECLNAPETTEFPVQSLDSIKLPPSVTIFKNSLFYCLDSTIDPPKLIDFIRNNMSYKPPDSIETKKIVIIVPNIMFKNERLLQRMKTLMTRMRCYFDNIPFLFLKIDSIDEACGLFDTYSHRESKSIYPVIVLVPGDYTDPMPPCSKFHRNATVVQIVIDEMRYENGAGFMIRSKLTDFYVQHENIVEDRIAFDLLATVMNPFLQVNKYVFKHAQLEADKRNSILVLEADWPTKVILASILGFISLTVVLSFLLLFAIRRNKLQEQRELDNRRALVEHDELVGDATFTETEF